MAEFTYSSHDREKAKFDPNYRVKVLTRPEGMQDIEDGVVFMNTHYGTMASGASAYYSIDTPSSPTAIAIKFTFVADKGPSDITMYEDASLTALGTILPSTNLNRNSLNPELTIITSAPTVGYIGNQIWIREVQGGKEGGAGSDQMVMILKPSTTYLFKLSNENAQTTNYSWEFVFTEKTST